MALCCGCRRARAIIAGAFIRITATIAVRVGAAVTRVSVAVIVAAVAVIIVAVTLLRRGVIAVVRQRGDAEGRGRGDSVGVVVGVAQPGRGVVALEIRCAGCNCRNESVVIEAVQPERDVVTLECRCLIRNGGG